MSRHHCILNGYHSNKQRIGLATVVLLLLLSSNSIMINVGVGFPNPYGIGVNLRIYFLVGGVSNPDVSKFMMKYKNNWTPAL